MAINQSERTDREERNMQQLIIAGRITKDAELRRTQSGDEVAGFSVAVSNGKDKQGNWRDSTFYDCSLFGKRASALVNALSKGTNVTVTGRPSAREYNGKVYLQCIVDQVALQGGPRSQEGQQHQDSGGGYAGLDDEVPFAPEWRA
jgi:single-strand DNA-binding protein